MIQISSLKSRWLALGFVAALLPLAATAEVIGGVEFPQGAISFADEGAGFTLGTTTSSPINPAYLDPANSLGLPNGASTTLGSGGIITLKFTDNWLTGSGSSALDLWIFEIGPDVEDTFVWISQTGLADSWLGVGKVFGATSGIDIDPYLLGAGLSSGSLFSYVKLQDDPNEGDAGGPSPGADIDAVGAISTIRQPPVDVPEPATLALFGTGLAGLLAARRRRRH